MDEQYQFGLGSLVQLNCGGLALTVNRRQISKDGVPLYEVVWFDESNEMQAMVLREHSLKAYVADEEWR